MAALESLVRRDLAPSALRLTGSGTIALAAAIRIAARGQARPLVALPAWACYDLATAADMVDARVVLYDLDPRTLGPDWDSLRAALAAGPSSVVVVHLYGYPVDMGEAGRAAIAAGVTLIEDAAQGVGATLDDRPAGALAPLAVLSFGRGKGRTGGRGGALLAHGDVFREDVERLALGPAEGALPDALKLAAQWLLARPSVYGLLTGIPALGLGETVYRAPEPLTALSGAGVAALARVWDLAGAEAATRRRNVRRLAEALEGSESLARVQPVPGAVPGYLRFPVIARGPAPFATERARRLGVMPGYPKSLADLEGFRTRIVNQSEGFEAARMLARQLGTLPTHSRLTPRDIEALLAWLR
jgi:dTDP-4-amino-4,6-dideoxygalactose transaminase